MCIRDRARAYENMIGIATVNYPSGQPDCNGHSSAFDGMAYKPSETVSRDTLVIEAGEQEGIYLARFPIDELREYRRHEVHGNAYRHPQKYHLLISEAIEAVSYTHLSFPGRYSHSTKSFPSRDIPS